MDLYLLESHTSCSKISLSRMNVQPFGIVLQNEIILSFHQDTLQRQITKALEQARKTRQRRLKKSDRNQDAVLTMDKDCKICKAMNRLVSFRKDIVRFTLYLLKHNQCSSKLMMQIAKLMTLKYWNLRNFSNQILILLTVKIYLDL